MKCNKCLTNETYTKIYHHDYQIQNRKIEFEAERRFCSKCNNLVYDKELDNNAGRVAISVYNKKFEIPSEKIVELRKNIGYLSSNFPK